MRVFNRARLWLERDRRERELDEEIRLHREMLMDQLVRDGVPPAEARAEAQRRLGHLASAKESSFDEWSFPRLDSFLQDVRYAVRGLGRSKAFALTAVLTLGIGLGINTVIFTVFNAYALRPLAVRDPSSLYQLSWQGKQESVRRFSWREYQELRQRPDILTEALAQGNAYGLVSGNPSIGLLVSGNYFSMLGAGMQLGRPILDSDAATPGANAVVVISHLAWKKFFNGRTSVIGEKLVLSGNQFEIVGVTRPEFTGFEESPHDYWIPLTMYGTVKAGQDLFGPERPPVLTIFGRLRPDLLMEQAQVGLASTMRGLARARVVPGAGDVRAELEPRTTTFQLTPQLLAAVMPVFGAFLLVLGAGCANVSNMVLARAVARQREFAMRLSLGAGRVRLVRQLLTESMVVAALACAVGLAVAHWGMDWGQKVFFQTAPPEFTNLIRLVPLEPDYRVFAWIFGLATLAALSFGLLPALQSSRLSLTSAIHGNVSRHLQAPRLRRILVVGQVTVCTVLTLAAALFVRNSAKMQSHDIGLQLKNVVHVDTGSMPEHKEVAGYLAGQGFEEVALVRRPPIMGQLSRMQVRTNEAKQAERVGYNLVSANYFTMMGIPMVAGRAFSTSESEAENAVAVVSEATAKRLWANENALGKTLLLAKPGSDDNPSRHTEAIVVGVAKDVTSGFVFQGRDATCLYLPVSSRSDHPNSLLVRAAAGGGASTIRDLLVKRWPKMGAAADTFPMQAILDTQLYPFRAMAWIGSALGIVALFLSLSGMYGVMAYIVNQRKREIGIRMALGATAQGVVGDMMKHSGVLTLGGLAVGLGIAWSAIQVIRAVVPLPDLLVTRWADLILVLGVIAVASSTAALIPSARAASVDPAETLRGE